MLEGALTRIGPFGVAAVVVALTAGGGAAIAAIPDSNDGEVHLCYVPASGDVEVIDHQAGRRCGGSERELVINQRGPSGPAGPPGPTGEAGPPGPPGLVEPLTVSESKTLPPDPDPSVLGDNRVGTECPEDHVAVGGGHRFLTMAEPDEDDLLVVDSSPMNRNRGWSVVISDNRGEVHLAAIAVCVAAVD